MKQVDVVEPKLETPKEIEQNDAQNHKAVKAS